MKGVVVANLAAAIIVSAIQWAALFHPVLDTSDRDSSAIAVTTHRQSIFKY